jgi:hypothetical protein
MVGSAADPAVLALAAAARVLAAFEVEDDDDDDEDNVRPGATADTSAAKPAVSAVAPAITQRRVDRTRPSAASRINTARGRSTLEDSCSIVGRENHRSVRAV